MSFSNDKQRSRKLAFIKYRANQFVFEYFALDIYQSSNLSSFHITSRTIQLTEMDVLLIVHSITRKACLVRPYDVNKKRWLDLQMVHNEVASITESLIIPCH
ncbi:uncharacterized protein TNCV_76201 [Trichonephila clavipes]|nr:uncharacterized protein TNCV_76201 [Trichonephila clavipes]